MMRGDFDSVMKAMFRARGETQRIDIADALGRQGYRALSLGTLFEMAVSEVRHCLKIRNQYAHCIWWDDNSGQLALANLEDIAGQNDLVPDLKTLPAHHIDAALLERQLGYFAYTDDRLAYVNFEGCQRNGLILKNPVSRPKQLSRPALNIP